ncbi:MAG: dihydropteroate synthase [Acidimicrobiia bacterium]
MFTWKSHLVPGRPAVMGVVNVTPDSFSDGGRWLDADAAVAHGRALVAAGAELLDVGGESTRPGADPVDADTERARVLPVVEQLAAHVDVPVSVDTAKAEVAHPALAAGATVVNDVTAGADPAMFPLVAERGAGLVIMHMQGEPRTMQAAPRYEDVVADVATFLTERVAAAQRAGVAHDAIVADPGIGFGKTLEHNLALLGALQGLREQVGVPLLVGTSRKRFLAAVLERAGRPVPAPNDRDVATLATVAWCALRGVDVVRVHDVAGASRAARLVQMIGEAA